MYRFTRLFVRSQDGGRSTGKRVSVGCGAIASMLRTGSRTRLSLARSLLALFAAAERLAVRRAPAMNSHTSTNTTNTRKDHEIIVPFSSSSGVVLVVEVVVLVVEALVEAQAEPVEHAGTVDDAGGRAAAEPAASSNERATRAGAIAAVRRTRRPSRIARLRSCPDGAPLHIHERPGFVVSSFRVAAKGWPRRRRGSPCAVPAGQSLSAGTWWGSRSFPPGSPHHSWRFHRLVAPCRPRALMWQD